MIFSEKCANTSDIIKTNISNHFVYLNEKSLVHLNINNLYKTRCLMKIVLTILRPF